AHSWMHTVKTVTKNKPNCLTNSLSLSHFEPDAEVRTYCLLTMCHKPTLQTLISCCSPLFQISSPCPSLFHLHHLTACCHINKPYLPKPDMLLLCRIYVPSLLCSPE